MIYREVRSLQDLDSLIHKINLLHFGENSSGFLKKEGRFIYGIFVDDEGTVNENTLIVFGDYLSPEDIKPMPNNSIFAKVKAYGKSKKYRGLLDTKGNILLQALFETINSLTDTRLVGSVKGKSAVICNDGTLMTPIIYDRIYSAGENTIAFERDGKCGFMSANAKIVIEAEYECGRDYAFKNGYARVTRIFDNDKYEYSIDHYGLMVSEMECISINNESFSEHNLGTGYYPYGELPDALDAYEGDESNRWNTD